MKMYKAVIIGCGKIGIEKGNYQKQVQPGTHAGAYLAHPRITLAGFMDIRKERLKEAVKNFPGVPIFDSADEMLCTIKPDIVSIATHPNSHLSLIKIIAKYRVKAVVCEKPMAASIVEAEEIINVCRKNSVLLFINHTRRFDPLFQKLKKQLVKGIIGRVVEGTYYYYNGLFNNGTHAVDFLRFFLGEIDWVRAFKNKLTANKNLKHDLNVDAVLHFKNGAVVYLQSLPANYGFSDIYFFGTKGSIFLKKLAYEIEYRRLIKNKYFKGYYELEAMPKVVGSVRSYMKSMPRHVVDCLEWRVKPISMGEDGLKAIKILTALKMSAQNDGQKILFDRDYNFFR